MTIGDLEQKVSQNPSSPLFARLAGEYLAEGRVEEAKKLCLAGVDAFPSYVTAHLLLARCYREEHDTGRSLEHLSRARTLHPASPYLDTLFEEWNTGGPGRQMEQPPSRIVAEEISEAASPAGVLTGAAGTAVEAQAAEPPPEPVSKEMLQPATEDLGPQVIAVLERFDAAPPPAPDEAMSGETVTATADEITAESFPEPATEQPESDTMFEELPVPAASDDLDRMDMPSEERTDEPAPQPLDTLETESTTFGSEDGMTAESFPEPAAGRPESGMKFEEPAVPSDVDELGREEIPSEEQPSEPAPPPSPEPAHAVPASRPYDEEGRIVTKTLAEIYVSQGAYSEAILTYQLLKTLRPGQSEEYDRRIKELEPKIHDKPAS